MVNGNLAYEFDSEPEQREELLDGKPVLLATPSANHHFVAENIWVLFRDFLRGKTCRAITDGMRVYLTDKDRFIPNVMIVCDRKKIRPDGIHGAPDLMVEVLSPATARMDRGRKMQIYGRSGVREYWIVDLKSKSVEQYLLRDGELRFHNAYTVFEDWEFADLTPEERERTETAVRCDIFPGLELPLDDIFHDLID